MPLVRLIYEIEVTVDPSVLKHKVELHSRISGGVTFHLATIIYRVPIITERQRAEEEGVVRGFVLLGRNTSMQCL